MDRHCRGRRNGSAPAAGPGSASALDRGARPGGGACRTRPAHGAGPGRRGQARARPRPRRRYGAAVERSEEHTSELQSHSDLVCRLLLEKKKKKKDKNKTEERKIKQRRTR